MWYGLLLKIEEVTRGRKAGGVFNIIHRWARHRATEIACVRIKTSYTISKEHVDAALEKERPYWVK